MPDPLKMPKPEEVSFSALNFAPYNPRVMLDHKMRALKASLRAFGLVVNLVVQRHSPAYGPMVLVGGHQRTKAVREICAEDGVAPPDKAWAIVLDVDDATAKQLNIALNRIEGDFDPYMLAQVLQSIEPAALDLDSIGFSRVEVDALLLQVRPPEVVAEELEAEAAEVAAAQQAFPRPATLMLEFADHAARDEARALLVASAEAAGKTAGMLVLEMLRGGTAKPKRAPRTRGADA